MQETKFANKLKELRLAMGITQKQLSDLSGVSQVTLCLYEQSKKTPNGINVAKLSKALNVEYDELISYVK